MSIDNQPQKMSNEIKNSIIDEFENGSMLNSTQMAKKYGVSKWTVKKMRQRFNRGELRRPNQQTTTSNSQDYTYTINDDCESSTLYKEDEIVANFSKWDHAPNPEEIIKHHNIDITKWKMNQVWVKEKGDHFTTSASFVPLSIKDGKLSIEEIEEVITKSLKSVKQNKSESYISDDEGYVEKALFVYLSDKHFGAHTLKNSIYENTYNEEVIRTRMMRVRDEIGGMCDKFNGFDKICVFDMGDSVDGWNGHTTRGGHKLPQMVSNREVFEMYFNIHKEFFDSIMDFYDGSVDYKVANEDNHGGDFGYICNKSVAQYLTAKYDNINVEMSDKHISHFNYGQHTFLLSHGKDSLDMKRGYPLTLDPKTETHILKYLAYHNISNKQDVHFIKGDLHQNASQYAATFRYRNVMSLYGMSRWSMVNFGPSKAGCSFDIVEKNTSNIFESCITF